MDANQWRSKKKIESVAETLQGSSRRNIKPQARTVPPGNGVRPERARKNLNEKLDTVALNSPKKDPRVNLYGDKDVADEIFLKDEEMSLVDGGDSSPFCDKLLQRMELLGRDHDAKRLDNNNFSSRQEESAFDDVIEMKRKIHTLTAENSQLKKSLAAKEELAVSLQERKHQVESEFEALMTRLDATEKENAFLRYEYTVLEKDLEVKTEETEYTRKSMELTHKQQLRNVNKIVELEAECKRLRLLFRKKFPDRSISMRNEGEEMKRRNANNKSDLMMRDEAQSRKLKYDLLMEQIGNVRAENKNLMDIIMRKNMEIKDLSRGQKPLSASSFDIRSENSVISPSGSKEMKLLMDDFNEMEKLAIVCTEKAAPRGEDDGEKDDGSFDWIQVVLSAVSKQERISKRGVKELLQDIKIALGCPMTKDEIKRHLGLTKVEKVETEERQELKGKLEEAEAKIRSLEGEVRELRESKEKVEAEMEAEKSMKEDLDTKLHIAEAKLNETEKKLSSLEVEFDYRKSCCEELEGTCIELQLQLESVETKKPMQRNKSGWEVAAASVKLSECQETITNLRKQLRALSTTETSSTMQFLHKRPSLRESIEDATAKDSSSYDSITHDDGNNNNALIVYEPEKAKGEKMEMVPRKKQGVGFLKRLLFRKKRVSSKKYLALTM
uniref:Filament-like plant protein 7 n=1 Tax=Brassica campestris TaxID=3711 RepID=M4E0W7_BRACM